MNLEKLTSFRENQKMNLSALKNMRKPKTNMLKYIKNKNGNMFTKKKERYISNWIFLSS